VSKRLEVDETGIANNLRVGDRFKFVNFNDTREHVITNDHDSHYEYDGRLNKRLSKDTLVTRVGERDKGERLDRILSDLYEACRHLENSGDISLWMSAMSDIVHRAISYNMPQEVILKIEKLEKLGTDMFSKSKGKHGSSAYNTLEVKYKKQWELSKKDTQQTMKDSLFIETILRTLICQTIIDNHR
jgi:hypothetical protein